MKLLLLIFASLFHLSSGFMAELVGPLTLEECTGTEYAEFKSCVVAGFEEAGQAISGGEDEAFINHGRVRDLQGGRNYCSGCTGGAPRGTFCFTVCGGRRRLEQGTEKTGGLRRLQTSEVHFVNGELVSGGGEAAIIGNAILACFATHSAADPCIGSMDAMELTVTTA
jgi:hypothetical protein